MDCSPPGSSVHGIYQARILEWVAIPFSTESSGPRDGTCVSCIAGRFFTVWATWESPELFFLPLEILLSPQDKGHMFLLPAILTCPVPTAAPPPRFLHGWLRKPAPRIWQWTYVLIGDPHEALLWRKNLDSRFLLWEPLLTPAPTVCFVSFLSTQKNTIPNSWAGVQAVGTAGLTLACGLWAEMERPSPRKRAPACSPLVPAVGPASPMRRSRAAQWKQLNLWVIVLPTGDFAEIKTKTLAGLNSSFGNSL